MFQISLSLPPDEVFFDRFDCLPKKTFSSSNKKKYLSDIQKVSSTAPVKVEAHSAEWLSDVFSCVPINYLF